jgi:hypothetical protein
MCGSILNVIVIASTPASITGLSGLPRTPPLQPVLVTLTMKPVESGRRF